MNVATCSALATRSKPVSLVDTHAHPWTRRLASVRFERPILSSFGCSEKSDHFGTHNSLEDVSRIAEHLEIE